jgi:hypothetical protein
VLVVLVVVAAVVGPILVSPKQVVQLPLPVKVTLVVAVGVLQQHHKLPVVAVVALVLPVETVPTMLAVPVGPAWHHLGLLILTLC